MSHARRHLGRLEQLVAGQRDRAESLDLLLEASRNECEALRAQAANLKIQKSLGGGSGGSGKGGGAAGGGSEGSAAGGSAAGAAGSKGSGIGQAAERARQEKAVQDLEKMMGRMGRMGKEATRLKSMLKVSGYPGAGALSCSNSVAPRNERTNERTNLLSRLRPLVAHWLSASNHHLTLFCCRVFVYSYRTGLIPSAIHHNSSTNAAAHRPQPRPARTRPRQPKMLRGNGTQAARAPTRTDGTAAAKPPRPRRLQLRRRRRPRRSLLPT